MKTNEILQKDVQDALKWEPMLHAAEIGVIVKDGIVTLTGILDSYAKKKHAEDAAKNVAGVKAVVDDIEVVIGKSAYMSDTEIAADAVRMIEGSLIIPKDTVKVIVEDGWITLEGVLHWNFQRDMARHSVKDLPGVKGVINDIKVEADISEEIEKALIDKALERHWALHKHDIDVDVSHNRVILSGKVNSLYQKEEAEKIAWKTPGVKAVENRLIVDHNYL